MSLLFFLTFQAKERAPGTEIDGRKIRVDFSITERAHTPTPGIYLGKGTRLAL
jgi:transformer-2 protein